MKSFFKTKAFAYAFTIGVGVMCATGALAWTGPGARSPGDNSGIGTFLNTSATQQTKTGDLWTSGSFTGNNVTANQFCIGVSCINSWAGASGGWTTSGTNIYNSNTGNVGIGNASPAAKLTVGTTPGGANISFYDIGAGKIAAGTSLYSYGSICTGNTQGDCSGTGGVTLKSNGTVTASGNISINGDDSTGQLMLGTCCQSKLYRAASDGSLHIVSGQANIDLTPSANVIITQGSVGIGSASPAQKLDVTGNAVINGQMNAQSYCISGANCISAWPAAGGGSVAWASVTGKPAALDTSLVNGRVRMYDVGCNSSWASSCDANANGLVDSADTANTANTANAAPWAGITGKPYAFNQSTDYNSSPVFNAPTINSSITMSTGDTSGGANETAGIKAWNMLALYSSCCGSYTTAANPGILFSPRDGGATFKGTVTINGSVYAPAFYDSNNTGYYLDPTNSSNINALVVSTSVAANTVTASAFYYSSDERLKKNIETISSDKALSEILALNPVTYNWKDASRGTTTQLGFIAQEVEKVEPILVTTDASTTLKAVDYARVTPLLVGAAQAQQAQIEAQQKEIDALRAEVEALKARK